MAAACLLLGTWCQVLICLTYDCICNILEARAGQYNMNCQVNSLA